MGLQRLGIINPIANSASTLFVADDQYLVSVIAANKSASAATIRVWTEPVGSTQQSEYAYVVYDLPVDEANSFETFRFAINQGDAIKVSATSSSISFSAFGLIQYDIRLALGVSSYASSSPSYPVQGMIWVDSDGDAGNGSKPIYIYNGTSWVSTAAAGIDLNANYAFTGNISIGNVSSTEISYLDGVTSGIQNQLDNKEKSIPLQANEPSSPAVSDLWVDSTSMQLKVYNGSTWVALGAAVDDSQLIIAQRMFA